MKKTILGLFLIGFMYQSYAQDNVLFEAKLKKEEVPVAIVESVNQDFPGLVVEEFDALPIEYVEDDIIVDRNIKSNKDYNTYQVTLKGKNRLLVATYNRDGNLISKVEQGKDIELPVSVDDAMVKIFPGWFITGDYFKMTHYKGEKKTDRYKLYIKKGKEEKKVYIDASGNIISVHNRHLI